MDEINFNIEDIENIDFDLDFSIKKIEPILQDKEITINENGTHIIKPDEEYDALNQVSVTVDAIEDLTEELETYNNELTTQEITMDNIIEALKYKGIGEPPKFAPKYILFAYYSGDDLSYELSNLDTSNMTVMTRMFQNASSITNLDLTPYKYNTSNVTNMEYMFQFTYKMTNFDISNFDTSNVTTMRYFCNGAYALLEADLSALNLSKVEDMRYMFSDDSAIKKIVFPDLPMGANLNNLCSNCSALEEIIFGDIGSSYGTSNKVVVRNLLAGCTSLKYIDIRGLNFYSISSANTSSMFTGVPADCEIIVADDTAKQWVLGRRSDFTNIKTVAEL